MKRMQYRSFFSPLFLPVFWLYGMSLILMIAVSAGALFPPYVYKQIYDRILPQQNFSELIHFGIYIVLIYIGTQVISGINIYIIAYANTYLHNNLRVYLFERILYAPYQLVQSLGTGQIIGRFQEDLGGISSWLSMVFGTVANCITTLLTVGFFVYILDYRLFLGVLPTIPLYILVIFLFKKKIFESTLDVQQQQASILHRLSDFIQGLRDIGLSLTPYIFTNLLRDEQRKALRAVLRMSIINSVSNGFSGLIGISGPTVMLVYGGYLTIRNEITVGTLIAFITVIHRLYQTINMLCSVRLQQYAIRAHITRIDDLVAKIPTKPKAKSGVIDRDEELSDYTIRADNLGVIFGDNIILKDVSFTVPMGATCLVRGPNGSGKSTLMELIAGLQIPTQGAVMLGSHTLDELSERQIRKTIGIVSQKPHIFNMSLYDNIACAKTDVPKKVIREIISDVGLTYDNSHLNMSKLTATCGDGAILPSGGETHRISLARTLLLNPKILILDETFSSLPEGSGDMIIQAIRKKYRNITLIIVSHRPLETVEYDMEIVLDLTGKAEVMCFMR